MTNADIESMPYTLNAQQVADILGIQLQTVDQRHGRTVLFFKGEGKGNRLLGVGVGRV